MSDLDRVLFDAPGPRARARARVATVVVCLVVVTVVVLAVVQFGRSGQLAREQWLPFRVRQIWTTFLLPGLGASLLVTLVATVLAVPLGALVALGRLSRNAPVRWIARGYIELFRSLPVLLLLYVFQLGLPLLGVVLPIFWQLTVPIVLSAVAYLAALVGAGVQSLDRGQTEAAQSIGLRYWPMMRLVVLPQVVRRLTPALVTEVVAIFIATTLGYAVSYTELLHNAQVVGQFYQVPVQAYLVVAVVYVAINATLSRVATLLQRRQAGGRNAAVVARPAGPR